MKIIKIETGCDMPDGVYQNSELPEDRYHDIKRASQTLFKAAANSPMMAWAQSWLNPAKHSNDTEAKKSGRAYHKYILEGAEAFNESYAPYLDKSDYPDALDTVQDMINWLQAKKLAVPKGRAKKEEYIQMVMRHPERPVIWDQKKKDHEADHGHKELLRSHIIHDIQLAAKTIQLDEHANKSVSGGYPEVSVLYHVDIPEIDGSDIAYRIPCKARFDYLKNQTLTDLKSFSLNPNETLKKTITKQIGNYRYNVQVASYLQAWSNALPLIAEKRIIGDDQFIQFVNNCAKREKAFFFLFQTRGLPVSQLFQFPLDGIAYSAGQHVLHEGQVNFCRNIETYGADPWINTDEPELLADEDFPPWMFE